jgi:transcriptional regulator with XRE-family HTH domain
LSDIIDNYDILSNISTFGREPAERTNVTFIAATPARELSVNVVLLRARAGLSQVALSKRAGVSRDTLSRIERGEADPTLSVLEKLATALGVTVPDLFVHGVGDDDPDDNELVLRAAAGRERNVGARALIAAIDEAAGHDPARYSRAGRPRLVR